MISLHFRYFVMKECRGLPESQKEIRLRIYSWQNGEVFKPVSTDPVLSVASEMGFFVSGMPLPFSHPLTDVEELRDQTGENKLANQPTEATIYQVVLSLPED